MERYSEYKDSGVEWIGEIPSHWKLMSNKYFTKSRKNKSETGEEELLSVSEYHGVIPRRNIREGEEHLTRSESLEGYLKVKKGDLVSNIMLMWKRGLGVSEFEGIVSPSYSVFSFIDSNPRYFHYLFRTDQYVSEFRRNSTGVIESRLRLYDDKFGSIKSHYPPLNEQQQIVSFLDNKTQLIDSLLEQTKRKIELLKEKRTSLINEVVTKGLNPNVEMKDSGVEWIGEIPSHWEMKKLAYLTDFITCGHAATPKYVQEEEGMPFLSALNCRPFKMDLSKFNYITHELHDKLTKYRRPLMGDILITRVGAGIGQCCLIDTDMEFSIYVSLTHIRVNQNYLNKYMVYFFNSHICKILNKEGTVSAGGQGNLNVSNLEQYRIPISTNKGEQQQIVEYLDEQTQKIDKTISIEEKRIELLKEYRQSLISEVVTGKRKVTTDE